jgi:hypothetical protein
MFLISQAPAQFSDLSLLPHQSNIVQTYKLILFH